MVDSRPVSILLIDDDDVDAMAVRRALKKHRIANPLTVARDGIEGLEALRSGKVESPFMILLDLNMPRMNGLEFLEELRKDEELKASVVFVLTTSDEDQDIAAAYAQQVAGYILKSNVGPDFLRVLDLLGSYWRVVELPE